MPGKTAASIRLHSSLKNFPCLEPLCLQNLDMLNRLWCIADRECKQGQSLGAGNAACAQLASGSQQQSLSEMSSKRGGCKATEHAGLPCCKSDSETMLAMLDTVD